MSVYESNPRHLREVLIYFFNNKTSAAEAHRMLSDAYGEAAMSEKTYRERFQCFKSGGFCVKNRHGSGRPKVFENEELTHLLDDDSFQSQEELAEPLEVS
ncbi:unnamed protein product [Parnassius mnemosyne]|uniref:Mos1 transposase HTH domain-containing protein n=1 Tax=Parnassius mnemosyne TaxID=213953 RepID=A0AAV1K8M0_9NEOP